MRRLVLVLTICALGVADTAAAETQRFEYTGGEQVFVVPTGVTEVTVEAIGGRGGVAKLGAFKTVEVPGGFGALARATLSVIPGQRLYVSVGGNGGDGYASPGQGGFNGGGDGGVGSDEPVYNFGAGGGGASDVRTNPRSDPLGSVRLVIAGGGGGAGNGEVDGGGPGGAAGAAGGNGVVASDPCNVASGGAPGGLTAPGQGGIPASLPETSAAGPGGNGNLGVGGTGGSHFYPGGGGGGGGGGLFGGGGGGGGAAVYPGDPNCTPGGGGGGSSGFGPGVGNTSIAIDQTGVPSVTFTYTAAGRSPAIALTGLSLSRPAFRVGPAPKGAKRRGTYGTAFRFTLSAAARVDVAIERQTRCKPRVVTQCARFAKVTALSLNGVAGANRVPFTGRYGKRKRALAPGRYRATVSATDAAGSSSQPQQVTFRVIAP